MLLSYISKHKIVVGLIALILIALVLFEAINYHERATPWKTFDVNNKSNTYSIVVYNDNSASGYYFLQAHVHQNGKTVDYNAPVAKAPVDLEQFIGKQVLIKGDFIMGKGIHICRPGWEEWCKKNDSNPSKSQVTEFDIQSIQLAY